MEFSMAVSERKGTGIAVIGGWPVIDSAAIRENSKYPSLSVPGFSSRNTKQSDDPNPEPKSEYL